jgi:hypothetical protein
MEDTIRTLSIFNKRFTWHCVSLSFLAEHCYPVVYVCLFYWLTQLEGEGFGKEEIGEGGCEAKGLFFV